jgi:hypothetical protein
MNVALHYRYREHEKYCIVNGKNIRLHKAQLDLLNEWASF